MDAYKGGSRKQLALQRRLDALFRALASDFLLREQFITDPAQIASEYINGKRIAPEESAAMNYLIYSCLANNYLISWLRDYAMRSDGKAITQQNFVRDFSTAVVEQRAHHVVSALAHFALHDTSRIQLDDNWLQVIFGRWHRFGEDGTDDATTAPARTTPAPTARTAPIVPAPTMQPTAQAPMTQRTAPAREPTVPARTAQAPTAQEPMAPALTLPAPTLPAPTAQTAPAPTRTPRSPLSPGRPTSPTPPRKPIPVPRPSPIQA